MREAQPATSVRALTGPMPALPAAVISKEDLDSFGYLTPVLAPRAAPKRASRSDVQIAIDQRVAEVHHRWHDEGCEAVWLNCPQAFYAVPREKVKDMVDMIRKAGRLGVRYHDPETGRTSVHKVQIRFGRDDLHDEDNNVIVSFTVTDKAAEEADAALPPRQSTKEAGLRAGLLTVS